MAEIMQHDETYCASNNLKIPANTRQNRLHNMKIAFMELSKTGIKIDSEITEMAIIEGDINCTSKLLWKVFQVAELPKITAEGIETEISEICGENNNQMLFKESRVGRYNSLVIANLLRWCIVIGNHYRVEIKDFDGSFSDGRIYGCIVHYYLPHVIFDIQEVLRNGDSFREFMNSGNVEEAQKYRKKNIDILFQAIQEIQLIPWLISQSQVNDKVIITFVAYLFERLLSIKKGQDPLMLLAQISHNLFAIMNESDLHEILNYNK